MKVGDLVRCVWQPRGSEVDKKTQCVLPMKYEIKGECGIIIRRDKGSNIVMFPKFVYEHSLADSALELLG